MKKITLLSFVLALVLTACGDDKDGDNKGKGSDEEETPSELFPDPNWSCSSARSNPAADATLTREGDVWVFRVAEEGYYFCSDILNLFEQDVADAHPDTSDAHYFPNLQNIPANSDHQYLSINNSVGFEPRSGTFFYDGDRNNDELYTGDRESGILTIGNRKFQLIVIEDETAP